MSRGGHAAWGFQKHDFSLPSLQFRAETCYSTVYTCALSRSGRISCASCGRLGKQKHRQVRRTPSERPPWRTERTRRQSRCDHAGSLCTEPGSPHDRTSSRGVASLAHLQGIRAWATQLAPDGSLRDRTAGCHWDHHTDTYAVRLEARPLPLGGRETGFRMDRSGIARQGAIGTTMPRRTRCGLKLGVGRFGVANATPDGQIGNRQVRLGALVSRG
jgi:hypothetical protein